MIPLACGDLHALPVFSPKTHLSLLLLLPILISLPHNSFWLLFPRRADPSINSLSYFPRILWCNDQMIPLGCGALDHLSPSPTPFSLQTPTHPSISSSSSSSSSSSPNPHHLTPSFPIPSFSSSYLFPFSPQRTSGRTLHYTPHTQQTLLLQAHIPPPSQPSS